MGVKFFPSNYGSYQCAFWMRRGTKRAVIGTTFSVSSATPDIEARTFIEYIQSLTKADLISAKKFLGRFITDASMLPPQELDTERAGVAVLQNTNDSSVKTFVTIPWLNDGVDITTPAIRNAIEAVPLARLQKVQDIATPDGVVLCDRMTNQSKTILLRGQTATGELGDTPDDQGGDMILGGH